MKLIYIFDMLKNMYDTEYGVNSFHNSLTRPIKKLRRPCLEVIEGVFLVVSPNFYFFLSIYIK